MTCKGDAGKRRESQEEEKVVQETHDEVGNAELWKVRVE